MDHDFDSPRARARVAASLGCLLLLGLTAACRAKETSEVLIRKTLDAGAAALEARDVEGASAVLADDYKDDRGRSRKQLKQLAFFALQQGPVLVSMQSVDIHVEGMVADVTMKVLAVQGSAELKTARDLLPTNARAFDLTLRMTNTTDGWKVAAINGLGGGSD